MAIDISKAFELPEHGILLNDGSFWLGAGTSVPSHNAPQFSTYFRNGHGIYIQIDAGTSNHWHSVVEFDNPHGNSYVEEEHGRVTIGPYVSEGRLTLDGKLCIL